MINCGATIDLMDALYPFDCAGETTYFEKKKKAIICKTEELLGRFIFKTSGPCTSYKLPLNDTTSGKTMTWGFCQRSRVTRRITDNVNLFRVSFGHSYRTLRTACMTRAPDIRCTLACLRLFASDSASSQANPACIRCSGCDLLNTSKLEARHCIAACLLVFLFSQRRRLRGESVRTIPRNQFLRLGLSSSDSFGERSRWQCKRTFLFTRFTLFFAWSNDFRQLWWVNQARRAWVDISKWQESNLEALAFEHLHRPKKCEHTVVSCTTPLTRVAIEWVWCGLFSSRKYSRIRTAWKMSLSEPHYHIFFGIRPFLGVSSSVNRVNVEHE